MIHESRPFSILGSLSSLYLFLSTTLQVFVDSVFTPPSRLREKRYNGRTLKQQRTTYAERNNTLGGGGGARQRGANVKGVGDLKGPADACAGGG